jgi:hypothetical protein
MLHLAFYWLLGLMLFVGLLAGCAPLDAVGTGVGMGYGYNPPIYQPMPVLSAHRQSCVMQQDPIGTLWGTPTMRMSCY